MLLKSKFLMAAVVMAVGLVTFGCADDEAAEEPVQPSVTEESAPSPDSPAENFVPETLFFAFDDYTLNMEAQTRLQALSDHLKAMQNAVVQIEGHCDERGSIEYNLALGERRAQSVKNYLVQLGVDPARLSTISYGEEKPNSEGHDESSWGQNRRAEFTLTNN
jgi:peptidoglycan-associated lipoprotein